MYNRRIRAWIDHSYSQPIRLSFNKYWSDCIYPCQIMTRHGVIFPKVMYLLSNYSDTSLICTIAALISRVESLWKDIADHFELETSNGRGWMLVYLTNHCFDKGRRRQAQTYPFKIKNINSTSCFQERVKHYYDLSYYFYSIVHYCKLIY